MLFMVVEKFRNQDGKAVYRKLRDAGRGLPDGLKFVASYVSADLSRCFQLMEADDVTLVPALDRRLAGGGGVRGRAGGRRQDDARRAGADSVIWPVLQVLLLFSKKPTLVLTSSPGSATLGRNGVLRLSTAGA